MDRVASFITIESTQTKRSRDFMSPSGLTPAGKRLKPVKKSKWTPTRTNLLVKFVDKEKENYDLSQGEIWAEASKHLATAGRPKSAEACRLYYRRQKSSQQCVTAFGSVQETASEPEPEPAPDPEPLQRSVATQTDITVQLRTSKTSDNTSDIVNIPNLTSRVKNDRCANILHDLMIKRLEQHPLIQDDTNSAIQQLFDNCGDAKALIEDLWKIETFKNAIVATVMEDIEHTSSVLCKHPSRYDFHKTSSVLHNNSYTDLLEFEWTRVLEEACTKHPILTQILAAVSVPMSGIGNAKVTKKATTRIGMAYAILMQCREPQMSLVQRMTATSLASEHVHQKIYDVLQPLGVTVSPAAVQNIIKHIAGCFDTQVSDALKEGKRMRLVGDNVDVMLGVRNERKSKHAHMTHWFGSLVLMDTPLFKNLTDIGPQRDLLDLPIQVVLPSVEDMNVLANNYVIHLGRIAAKYITKFSCLAAILPGHITGAHTNQLADKTEVIPLPCLPYNESYYDQCIKILDYYENYVLTTHDKASVPLKRIHIGGDQKTRERFSGAKLNRAGSVTEAERYEHLGPTTFEFFHLKMKYLSVVYKNLYKEGSADPGTMEAEKIRISRNNVSPDVKGNYTADRDFFLHYVESHALELICDYFGMTSPDSEPRKHVPCDLSKLSPADLSSWFTATFNKILLSVSLPNVSYGPKQTVTVTEFDQVHRLPSGQLQTKRVRQYRQVSDDHIYNYAHNVLELGLLFIELEDACHLPDRDRILVITKYMLTLFRGHNTADKYSLELLRLLFHQYATLSQREAHESLYSLFVNTGGKVDTHVPADLVMEHAVKDVKSTIRALGSNKSKPEVVTKWTSAMPGIKKVSDKFSQATGVIVRAHKHKTLAADADVKMMVSDLRKVQPFSFTEHRAYAKFPSIKFSLLVKCDYQKLCGWIEKNKKKYARELGQ